MHLQSIKKEKDLLTNFQYNFLGNLSISQIWSYDIIFLDSFYQAVTLMLPLVFPNMYWQEMLVDFFQSSENAQRIKKKNP